MKKNLLTTVVVLVIGVAGQLSAQTLLVDRGLPTANLNNAAGADRSNVGWLSGGYTTDDYWVEGDTFQNTSAQNWTISKISLWSFSPTATVSLWGAIAGSLNYGAPTVGTITPGIKYSNGQTYQGYTGLYRDIYQLDFQVDISLLAGQTFNFFLDGTGNGIYVIPFAHASNKDKSGSPQEGSDNFMLEANVVNGALVPTSVAPWTSQGNWWDKASDLNVQVSGTVPDGGMTLALLGTALSAMGMIRRKMA